MQLPRAPAPRRSNGAQQGGWGLTQTLLTVGAISVMSAAIYLALRPADAGAQIKAEQDNLRAVSQSIDRSFGLLGSFEDVSTARVMEDSLAPERMTRGGGLRTQWGSPITVLPFQVDLPNDAFVVSYPDTPADVCSGLAASMARDVHDIRVGGASVFAGGSFDPGLAAQRCDAGDVTMEFVFHSGLVAGQAVAAPVVLPPTPPTITPPPSTPPDVTIPDAPDVDPVTPGTPATPPPAPPPAVVPPPVSPPGSPAPVIQPPPSSTPPPPPVTPPGVRCSAPASWIDYETRTPNCAANQFGVRHQRREQEVSYSCPEAWDNPVETRSPWSAWSDTTNTCASCAPTTGTRVVWQDRSGSCPSGQSGSITWEEQRNQSRTGTYNCPAGTTTLPSPNWGSWVNGSWTGNTRNRVSTCAPNCVVPDPATQTDVDTRTATREQSCPSGQEGVIEQQRPERRTRTRTASCPAPTGAVAWTPWSPWSSWQATGNWETVSNTCAPAQADCKWEQVVYSVAPNWGNLDGEAISYDDGQGGGCSASWGPRFGDSGNFRECEDMIPRRPPGPGASYFHTEYSNYGGGVTNDFGYEASCGGSPQMIGEASCNQDSLCSSTMGGYPGGPGWTGVYDDFDTEAQAMCEGSPGRQVKVSWCESSPVMCDADVQCP